MCTGGSRRTNRRESPTLAADKGWAAIGVARAYPNAEVIGIDSDSSSINDARRYPAEEEVDVRFEAADAEQLSELGPFDLVLILDVLHDLARPVENTPGGPRGARPPRSRTCGRRASSRHFYRPGGSDGTNDVRVERQPLSAELDDRETNRCCGTVIRAPKVKAFAEEAGFTGFDVVDVDAGFFRLYRLAP
jgi:hypothetical protein